MKLKPLNVETVWSEDFYRTYPDSILRLEKVLKKNDYKFKRIGFYSSPCLGSCELMYLEFDSIGNLIFYGDEYYIKNKSGLHSGKIKTEKLVAIFRKAQTIRLKKRKQWYGGHIMDAQGFRLWFETNDGIYEIVTVNHVKEAPIAIINFSYMLMELYKKVELTKDSSAINDFQFKQIKKEVLHSLELAKKRTEFEPN